MRKLLIVLATIPVLSCTQALRSLSPSDLPSEADAVMAVERARLNAFGANDKVTFDRLVAPGLTMTHSNGDVLTKLEEMSVMRSSTPEDPLPELGIDDVGVRIYGNAAVMTGQLIETSEGRKILGLRFTNTYIKAGKGWRLVAGQLTKVSPD